MRPINEIYREKKKFVCDLELVFARSGRIRSMSYKRDFLTGDEVMMITDMAGDKHYVDVTADSLEAILTEACLFNLRTDPIGLIRNSKRREEVAAMFCREA